MEHWLTRSAADQGRALAAGEIDARELAEAYLDAIEAHPESARIYARTTPERARVEAKAAHTRLAKGRPAGPLDGVPISWKDLYDVAGYGCEGGTRLLAGRMAEADASVVARGTAAGTVCLGKTHTTELAFFGLGPNPMAATAPNAIEPHRAPGGSSSGAAVSTNLGLAAAGIGSDTGGSVRIPAAWNNLVGLKTTAGRVSLEGTVPLCLRFDTVGPLTRSVEDAAHVLALLEGGSPADLRGANLKGRRFADLQNVAKDDLRDGPRRAFDDALDRLRDAGAEIVPLDVPELNEAMGLSGLLYTTEAYGLWRDVIEANPDAMYPEILERFRSGKNNSGPDYIAAWSKLKACRAAWDAATSGFDAVLAPTAPIMPPNLDRLLRDHEYYVTENLLALRNTRIGNLMGLAALTLPTGTPGCGLMMMGYPGSEETLLRLGSAAEAALA